MKLNRRNFLLIIVLLLNGLINDFVASEESEFEAETEIMETTLPTLVNSDEDGDNDFDLSSEPTNGMDTTGLIVGAEQIGPIIEQLFGPLSTAIQPYLGPLAPLSSVLSSVISQTVTELVVNLLNETVSSAKRQEFLQIRNYTSYASYMVTVPKNGRFLLLTKTPTTYTKPKRRQKSSKGCTGSDE